MPATYEPIATTTLGSSNATITFASVPSSYTDLVLVFVHTASGSGTTFKMTYNNDTASNYSFTELNGNGTSATSSRNNSMPYISPGDTTGTTPAISTIHLFSYAGSTNKTCLIEISRDLNGSGTVQRFVGLWRSTSAINEIDIFLSSGTFSAGTTATLYGILKA